MKRIKLLISLAVIASFGLAFLPASTAFADAPVHITFPVDEYIQLYGSGAYCGFENDIFEHYYGTITLILFVDKDGHFIKGHVTAGQMNGTWFANGKSAELQVMGPLNTRFEPAGQGIFKSLGTAHLMTLPGYGVVWGSAGLVTGEVIGDASNYYFTEVIYKEAGNLFDPNPEAF